MPEYLCQYGDCHETDVPITVTIKGDPGERVRFCTTAHLALWAKTKAKRQAAYEAHKISVADQEELGLITAK